jgi:hypothetical protein
VRCLVKGYSTNVDVYLIQALSVRFAGGVEKGGVGYDFDILVGNMVRPLKITNGIRHGYQMPRGGDILRTAEQTWESPPRLRAGQALVNVSGADHELSEEEPCGVMRLFSDHYFDDDLALRIIWRRARMGADRSLRADYASLGEPREFTEEEAAKGRIDYSHARSESALSSEFSTFDDRALSMQYGSTPFSGRYEQARYFYDIHIPYFLQHPFSQGLGGAGAQRLLPDRTRRRTDRRRHRAGTRNRQLNRGHKRWTGTLLGKKVPVHLLCPLFHSSAFRCGQVAQARDSPSGPRTSGPPQEPRRQRPPKMTPTAMMVMTPPMIMATMSISSISLSATSVGRLGFPALENLLECVGHASDKDAFFVPL